MIDVPPGETKVMWEVLRSRNLSEQQFHFICQSWEGAELQVGEECVSAIAGDLWRLKTQSHPVLLRAGAGPSLHLALTLSCL